jgi:hypothetical protein
MHYLQEDVPRKEINLISQVGDLSLRVDLNLLERLCSGIGLVQEAVRIECDSQSVIFLAKNPAYHSKTKHIDVQYHFVRDMIEEKKVSLMRVDTLNNVVDSLTKSLSTEKFSWCRGSMGIATLDC